jgi:phosphoribosyl 1,2-cyclic phosphodiesterase
LPSGLFQPASQSDLDQTKSLKVNYPYRITLKRVRNYEFHKKVMALFSYAFSIWEPPENKANNLIKLSGITPDKSFDRFRKDLTILAGYYDATYRLNGEVRFEAKSLSFAKMSEDEFEELYKKLIDVIVKHVLNNYSEDDLEEVLENIEAFDA